MLHSFYGSVLACANPTGAHAQGSEAIRPVHQQQSSRGHEAGEQQLGQRAAGYRQAAAMPSCQAHQNTVDKGSSASSLVWLRFRTACSIQVVEHAVMSAAAGQVLADDKKAAKAGRRGIVSGVLLQCKDAFVCTPAAI